MDVVEPTIWEIKPHTQAKHEILKRYLGAWFPILGSANKRILYIDGFAGPGEYKGGETGSPIIALETALDHEHDLADEIVFIFIEKREDRCDHLRGLLTSYNLPEGIKFAVQQGRFDEHMTEILDYIDEQNTRLAPTFALVDPFGFSGTPMAVVSRLMANPHCEVLITFMFDSVNRFVGHPQEKIQAHMDDLYGCSTWRKADTIGEPERRQRFLHDLYKDQLHGEAGVDYARSFRMINEGNQTQYFLFFGSNHYLGLKKMKRVMWAVDPGSGTQFSDYTDESQMTMFKEEPDFDLLRRLLVEWGVGTERSVSEIEEFVVTETPFAHTHFKRQVLKPLEKEGRVKAVTDRSRRFTYPKGTVVRFLED